MTMRVASDGGLRPYEGGTTKESVMAYVHEFGLPLAAAASVALAMRTHQQLAERCAQHYALDWQEQAKLIASAKPLNQWQVSQAVAFAKQSAMPLDCVYIFEQRSKLVKGILAYGWRLRAQADPRILKGAGIHQHESGAYQTTVMDPKGAMVPGQVPYVRVVYRVEFWNGETYEGVGAADGGDPQAKERGLSVLGGLAETRAANHAYRAALRLPANVENDNGED